MLSVRSKKEIGYYLITIMELAFPAIYYLLDTLALALQIKLFLTGAWIATGALFFFIVRDHFQIPKEEEILNAMDPPQ